MNRKDAGKFDNPGKRVTHKQVTDFTTEQLLPIVTALPQLEALSFHLENIGLVTLYNDLFSVSGRLRDILEFRGYWRSSDMDNVADELNKTVSRLLNPI